MMVKLCYVEKNSIIFLSNASITPVYENSVYKWGLVIPKKKPLLVVMHHKARVPTRTILYTTGSMKE